YQFWIHTRTIGRLGPLEAVLNTPSHHRVHHGANPEYLDRNYGAVFIIWDRMFGTFAPEAGEVRYGITTPLRSFHPVWAPVHYLWDLGRAAAAAKSWRRRLAVWVEPPERTARHAELAPAPAPPAVPAQGAVKYDVPVSRGLRAYVTANFVLAVTAA